MEKRKDKLSIVLPAYNEEKNISLAAETFRRIFEMAPFEYELVFVNDGSKDRTWNEIKKARATNINIKGICFSRNFGKEAAINAGLKFSAGDAVVVMDCDLQHPPEIVLDMYSLWLKGYDIVAGVKADRGKESKFRKFAANVFYKIVSDVSGIDMKNSSDFKLMSRKVVDILVSMTEQNGFFRALSSWVGFNTITIDFEVQDRQNGSSKWSLKSLVKYAITNITSFTTLPLQLVTASGGITFFLALILGAHTLFQYFTGKAVEGFTTVILLILFIGSLLMISLGIIGYYLSKIYEEVKQRPRYIISQII